MLFLPSQRHRASNGLFFILKIGFKIWPCKELKSKCPEIPFWATAWIVFTSQGPAIAYSYIMGSFWLSVGGTCVFYHLTTHVKTDNTWVKPLLILAKMYFQQHMLFKHLLASVKQVFLSSTSWNNFSCLYSLFNFEHSDLGPNKRVWLILEFHLTDIPW